MPSFLSSSLLLLLLLHSRTLHSSNTSELPETKNKTKSPKSNTQNSSFSSSSKLNKTANQPNKTITTTKKNATKTGQINFLKPLPFKSPSIPKSITTGFSAILPDLEKLSITSKHYLSKTRRDIAAGVKPFVGNHYAVSSAVILLPLLLLAAVFRRLLRSLLFVQAYLAVYFTTLSLTAVVTGLEPLWFFYAASPSAYAWTQGVQAFGYLVYLVAQGIGVMVGFSAGEGKLVGFAQMLLGLAVGMHYYVTVFHRAVAGEAPRANWKVHGIYAVCFVVICGLGRAGRRKKVYFYGEGGVDSKLS